MLKKAKEDSSKIQKYKQKLRESCNGEVFTNRLKQIVEMKVKAQSVDGLKSDSLNHITDKKRAINEVADFKLASENTNPN